MKRRFISCLTVLFLLVTINAFPVQSEAVLAANVDQSIPAPQADEILVGLTENAAMNGHAMEAEIVIANIKVFGQDGLVDYFETDDLAGRIAILDFANGAWQVISSYSPEFNRSLEELPQELLSEENKIYFYTNAGPVMGNLDLPAAVYTGHKLPWEGGIAHRVTQTPADHTGLGDWAYDFSMNVGTPLWASHSGTVALVKENSSSGACDSSYANMANYVVINNDGDDSATLYLHLNTNGVPVSVGQHVEQGDLVGYSGQTGYSCGAHLHFQVQNRGSWWAQSQQVIFDVPIGEPAKNASVVSNNYRTSSSANCSTPTATDVYVCDPALTPAYDGSACTSYWYRFNGYENHAAYVTLNAYSAATSSNSAVWRPNLPSSGTYEIFAYIGSHGAIDRNCGWSADTVSSDTNHAKYRIYSSGSSLLGEVEMDQYPYSNQWVSLGQFNLSAGTSAYVGLNDVTGETRISRNVSFGAFHFKLISPTCYYLTTAIFPLSAGTISLSQYSSGSCPSGYYAPGTQVTATANEGSGYVFSQWGGASTSTARTITVTMDGNKSLTANYVTAVYNTNWMTDETFTGETTASIGQIRTFFEEHGSCLADPISDADSQIIDIPALIHAAAVQYQINPKVLLATMQKEQSAISVCPTTGKLSRLMGISTVSTAREQIATSAALYRAYMNEQAASGSTRSGWAVGLAKETQDGVVVTPASRAIAALFTYTPYAGEGWGGDIAGVGGTYLFKSVWDMYHFNDPFPAFICYTLSTTANPAAGGAVQVLTEPSADCGIPGYEPDTIVQLSALPASGYTFGNWTGDASGTSATVSILMNGDKQATANFVVSEETYLYLPMVVK